MREDSPHIETAELWIQDLLKRDVCEVRNIGGMTQPVYRETVARNLERLGCHLVQSVVVPHRGNDPVVVRMHRTLPWSSHLPRLLAMHGMLLAHDITLLRFFGAGPRRSIVLRICGCT